MERIPCKNCITLAICIGDIKPKHSGTALTVHIATLVNKCALLTQYLYETPEHSSGIQHMKVVDFYKEHLY